MGMLAVYMSFLVAGYFIASRLRNKADSFNFLESVMMFVIYLLVLIMGLRMGIDEQVTSNLGSIGVKSAVITVACIAGSMGAIFITRKLLGIDRYGNIKRNILTSSESEEIKKDGETGIDSASLKSTVIILVLVAAGMTIGNWGIAGKIPEFLPEFDVLSGNFLTVLLCILLFVVGFTLGLSGTVVESVKKAGFRVLAFPAAAIAGTLLAGAAVSVICGFTVKEGLAISAGFGWYTYAPTVIAEAGSQYMIASAVSFMHNVIRETAGIILIPVLAKTFGYIESCGVAGVAAMDVCIPIVEKSCREDTVVYSFTIGLAMNLFTSVAVPFIMGM